MDIQHLRGGLEFYDDIRNNKYIDRISLPTIISVENNIYWHFPICFKSRLP